MTLQGSILKGVGRLVAHLAIVTGDGQGRVGKGVPPIAQRGVTPVVEARVRQVELADEVPDVLVAPAQDRVDPHQLRPVGVGGAELFLRGCVRIPAPGAEDGGLDDRPLVQHLLKSGLHGPSDLHDLEVVSRSGNKLIKSQSECQKSRR